MEERREKTLNYVKDLTRDDESQLFLRNERDILKNNVKLLLKKSSYLPDNMLYDLIKNRNDLEEMFSDNRNIFRSTENEIRQTDRIRNVSLTVNRPGEKFQADLADVNYLKPRATEGKFVLVIVDVFSQEVYLYSVHSLIFEL